MFSPWRSQYIASFRSPKKGGRGGDSIFRAALMAGNDEKRLIVWRSRLCFVIMNRYPYNSGHLMIVPNRQTADFLDLTPEELADMMATLQRAIRAEMEAMGPEGFNVGLNLGRVGGAGIESHVHVHLVPRWNGDTNFMPVIGDVKVISEDLKATLKKLKKAFQHQEESSAQSGQKVPPKKRRKGSGAGPGRRTVRKA
jgi:ATP adenylyltransferase